MALIATLSICMVVGSIVSVIYFADWGIGLSESIALIVFIGFSVDYIVHMTHVYVESVHDTRRPRVDNCYGTIGGTIIHGAITSFGAAVVMTHCLIIELAKFGILMMMTIIAALIFSLIFFPAFSYQAGPQYNEGNFVENVIKPAQEMAKQRKERRMREGYKKFQKQIYAR